MSSLKALFIDVNGLQRFVEFPLLSLSMRYT